MSENIIKAGRGISQEKISEIYEKQTQDVANLKKSQQDLRDKAPALMKFAKLNKRWKEYELDEDEILELGVEGDVRFFVKLKNVTVCWFALYGAPPERDPRGLRDIKDLDHTPFQVTKLSIEDIWCSMDNPKKTSDIQLVCLDELKVGYDKTREDNLPAPDGYVSIICQYEGGPDNEPDSHVLAQRTRCVMDLWALTEDVKRYESDNLSKPKDQFKAPGYRTGDKELCAAFGVGPKSITTVRKRVKVAGKVFEYDPETKEKRLEKRIINEIFAYEDKK